MEQNRRIARTLVGTILAAMILSACGSAAQPATPGATPTPQAPTAKTPKDVIVATMDSDIDTLDPQAYRSPAAYTVDFNLYALPMDYASVKKPDGSIVVDTEHTVSTLADVTLSADYKEVTYKIKPGFKFSNGDPVNAAALKGTLERAVLGPTYDRLVYGLITFTDPSQIEVVDDMTVKLHLKQGTPMTPKVLALGVTAIMDPAVTQAHATDADKFAANWYKTNVVGTGPYLVDKWTPGSEITLKVAPGWESKTGNKGVDLKIVPSAQERYALLKQGDVDVAQGLPFNQMDEIKKDPNLKVLDFPSRAMYYLAMDSTKPPFNNKLVRQAVAYAVPYQTLIDKVLFGYGRQAKSPVSIEMPDFDASTWHYDTSLDKAKALMQQAGVGSGFKTQLYVSLSRSEDQQVAVWVQAALKQIGIETEIQKLSEADYRAKWKKQELPMFFDNWLSWVNDPVYQLYFLFDTKNQHSTNPAGYANSTFDAAVEQAFFEPDPAKRSQLIKDAQKILIEDMPVVTLYQRDDVFVTRANVQGMNYWADRYWRFWMMSKS